ncbi:MAG: SPOR domain-containing protein [Spirochaetaceae bacterium]|jgi:DedD protein|nr:SPOR domain-containing protein [Spirochaetaceae bacterium]
MEKRKLLLISISVGVFLVIIIGASILMFSPRKPIPATAAAVTEYSRPIPPGSAGEFRNEQTPPVKVDLTDMVKNPDEFKGLQTPPPASAIQENNNHIYINGEPININGEFISGEQAPNGSRTNLVINVPSPKTPVVPAPVPVKPAVSPAQPVKPAVTAPAARPKPPAVSRTTPAAPPAAARPVPAPTGRTNYWVQTGAFSTQSRAEGAKELLAAKGITSIIENRNVEGKTFYRVRVGPYTSNSEAAYWLTLIKQINGFEESQIWQNQSKL